MANESTEAKTKTKRTRTAVKTDWAPDTTSGMQTRTVRTQIGSAAQGTRKTIEYVETRFIGIKELGEAVKLCGVKGLRAVRVLALGLTSYARKAASSGDRTIKALAEAKGWTEEQARAFMAE